MTSSLFQGLQPCLDPVVVEPHILMHQLAPPKLDSSSPWPQKPSLSTQQKNTKNIIEENSEPTDEIDKNDQLGSWNSLQFLTNNTYSSRKAIDVEPFSSRPYANHASSFSSLMSTESLEMCTESLGSESGSTINASMDEFSSLLEERQHSGLIHLRRREFDKKVSTFPPPLATISGSNCVRIRTHREGGRLVKEAMAFSSCSNFQAERENGELRLSWKVHHLGLSNELENVSEEENAEDFEEENYEDGNESESENMKRNNQDVEVQGRYVVMQ